MNERLNLIVQPLLQWYRLNARDLPWRHTDDPYRIWVSEIMLQQTRVAAVIGYYERFMEAFPTVQHLAEAPEEKLMKLWDGLGYYSRARNLQKAARTIVEQFDGRFPETYTELLSLSGVGEYTAGAIASSAFGCRVPAVDGNVLRVMSRILENDLDIGDGKTKKQYSEWLTEVLPESADDMRIFNQAMMELGAVVCVPNGLPKCEECPVSEYCKAAQNGTASQLPKKAPKKARRVEEKTVFVLIREDTVALRKRENNGLLAGLWEFPNVEHKLEESSVYEHLGAHGLTVTGWKKQLTAKHIFTHIEWHMTGYVLDVKGEDNLGLTWVSAEEFSQYAIPSAFAKFTKEVSEIL